MNWWLTQGRFAGTTWDCVLLCTCPEWLVPIYYPFWLVDVLTNILSDWVVPMHYAFWFVGVPRLIILIGWLIYPVHSDWVAFLLSVQFISVAQSCLTVCNPMDCSTARLPCLLPTPGACSDSCPLSRWCHPTISSCHPLLILPSVFQVVKYFEYHHYLEDPEKNTSYKTVSLMWGNWSPMFLKGETESAKFQKAMNIAISLSRESF